MKNVFKSIVFLLIGAALFVLIQEVLTPDWKLYSRPADVIYSLEKTADTNIDIIFVGSSHVYNAVSPIKLYRDKQITSYDLATAGQPTVISYFLLKRAFETQSPKLVVVDPSAMLHIESEGSSPAFHYYLDVLPFWDRIEVLDAYTQYENSDSPLSIVLPVVRYHTRWKELTAESFNLERSQNFYYTAGQWLSGNVAWPVNSREQLDWLESNMARLTQGTVTVRERGQRSNVEVQEPLNPVKSYPLALEYMEKIQTLCEAHDARLLFVSFPTMSVPNNNPAWTHAKSAYIRGYAESHGIPFLDLCYDVDVGIDRATDWNDENHLNVRGATKVTDFLENYLTENYVFPTGPSNCFDSVLETFGKVEDLAWLQSELDFYEYLKKLIWNKDNWTIYIAANSDYASNFTGTDQTALLEYLGLDLISEGKPMDSYLAVIDGGKIIYEALSDRLLEYETTLNGHDVQMSSIGVWNADYKKIYPGIQIDGTEYSPWLPGLDIVVWDKETDLPLDSVRFDTTLPEKPYSRTYANVYFYLRNYENAAAFR